METSLTEIIFIRLHPVAIRLWENGNPDVYEVYDGTNWSCNKTLGEWKRAQTNSDFFALALVAIRLWENGNGLTFGTSIGTVILLQ